MIPNRVASTISGIFRIVLVDTSVTRLQNTLRGEGVVGCVAIRIKKVFQMCTGNLIPIVSLFNGCQHPYQR